MIIIYSSHKRYRQRGYSLIELLIALGLGMAVLVGLSTVFVAVKQTFRFQGTTGRMQEDGAFALDSIAKNLRMAGYTGCVGIRDKDSINNPGASYFPLGQMVKSSSNYIDSSNPLSVIKPDEFNITEQPFTPFNFIRGFDNIDGGRSGMLVAGEVPVKVATDSMFFAGGSDKVVAVSDPMAKADSPLTVAAGPYKWNSVDKNKLYDMIVSDCKNSFIFKGKIAVSEIPNKVNIEHSLPENIYSEFMSKLVEIKVGVKKDVETITETSIIFEKDAIIMPAEWSFYYIATRPEAKTSSLYRVFYDGNKRSEPEEVVSNVESMRLHYGESTNIEESSSRVIDVWRTCAAGPATLDCDPVSDWSRIVAVRIGLMMVSAEDNVNSGGVELNVPDLLGITYSIPLDASKSRLRKEFSTTVVLRNRVNW